MEVIHKYAAHLYDDAIVDERGRCESCGRWGTVWSPFEVPVSANLRFIVTIPKCQLEGVYGWGRRASDLIEPLIGYRMEKLDDLLEYWGQEGVKGLYNDYPKDAIAVHTQNSDYLTRRAAAYFFRRQLHAYNQAKRRVVAPVHVPSRPTGVYLIDTDDGYHKIGISNDPVRRLSALQAANPHKLTIAAFQEIAVNADYTNAANIEHWLHRKYKHNRIHREWFQLSGSEHADLVQDIKTGSLVALYRIANADDFDVEEEEEDQCSMA